jgi:hypothetical protein
MDGLTQLEAICHNIEQETATISIDYIALGRLNSESTFEPILDDISDSASVDSVGSISDIIAEMRNCTECLVDLIPALENPARDVALGNTQKNPPILDVEAQALGAQPWWTFFHLTEDKFPFADRDLIIRISQTTWRRRERILLKHEAKAEAYGSKAVIYK